MNKSIKTRLIHILVLSLLVACSTSPVDKIQGVFEVNKESLKELMQEEMDEENAFVSGLLNVAIENAVIEFDIKGDSIKGIMFLAGETTLINSEIAIRNDTLVIKIGKSEAFLFPTETGLTYKASGADTEIELLKSERYELSDKTKDAIIAQTKEIKDKQEFEENLGMWQEGYYVDEFGDRTGEGYIYSIIRGSHENSISLKNEVYVKVTIQNEKLYFEIYNTTLSMKESFPDSEFGTMKLKFPDGSVKSERIFFYNNNAMESPSDDINTLYDYISNYDGVVKVLIDLSTASDYYSDKYQFTISRNNLLEVLSGLN